MSELVSVQGDPNSHGEGRLTASNNNDRVFIGGIKVNYLDAAGLGDLLLHPMPPTDASSASTRVFSEGIRVHRNNDRRYCGAVTIVEGQNKVYSN